jgi:hypothetical protein
VGELHAGGALAGSKRLVLATLEGRDVEGEQEKEPDHRTNSTAASAAASKVG